MYVQEMNAHDIYMSTLTAKHYAAKMYMVCQKTNKEHNIVCSLLSVTAAEKHSSKTAMKTQKLLLNCYNGIK